MSRARSNSLNALHQQPHSISLGTRANTDFNNPENRNLVSTELILRQQAPQGGIPPGSESGGSRLQSNVPAADADWDQKNLLSFDGGGIRGYATVLMVERLMKYIGEIERAHPDGAHQSSFYPHNRPLVTEQDDDGAYSSNFLPCHYFDYMVGTSTGGLIAVMLSRWRMTIGEARRQYEIFGRQIFAQPRKISFVGLPHDKYHKAPLVNAIERIVMQKTPENMRGYDYRFESFQAPNDVCRTAVIANQEASDRSSEGAFIFRSYDVGEQDHKQEHDRHRNYTAPINYPIWKVCRATSAAPTFFRAQEIDGKKYSDAALGTNNPTDEGIDEMHHFARRYPALVVSFGTGKPAERSKRVEDAKKRLRLVKAFDLANNLLRTAKAGLTDCENTHLKVQKGDHRDNLYKYSRFNIEEGLGKMKIDECKPETFETLRSCAKKELGKLEVETKLRNLARDLVKQRRERIKNYPSRWERFACCTRYECDGDCVSESQSSFAFLTRHEMAIHLRTVHSENERTIDERLDRCHREPDFPAGPW